MNVDKYIESVFPNLANGGFKVTSEADASYNCAAWAAKISTDWWWPDDDSYWPEEAPREETVDAFVAAYAVIGFVRCKTSDREDGYERIAIFAQEGKPKHLARQLPTGKWTSKLGLYKDIEHDTVEGLCGGDYGDPVQFMKRKIEVGPS